MRFMLFRDNLLLIFIFSLVSISCGPVEYMGQVGMKASKSLSGAKAANSKHYSPYEYWSAKYYLERARYKAGYADYQDSVRYGEKSEKMSKRAKEISLLKKEREIDVGKGTKSSNSKELGETTKPGNTKVRLEISSSNKGDNK